MNWYRLTSFVISLILFWTPPCFAGQWRDLGLTPTSRTEVAAAVLDGKIYLIGGFTFEGLTREVEVFDTATGTWSNAASIPDTLHHAAAVTIEDKLYVVGGFNSSRWSPVSTLYVYDPQRNAWEQKASMPTARGALAAGVLNGKLHALGGAERKFLRLKNTDAHEVYDPATDQWSIAQPLPTPRDHFTVSVVDGKLFAIGGRIDVDYNRNLDVVEQFDPATGHWETRNPLPTARSGITSQVLHGNIHVFGGESGKGTFEENEAYDPRTDLWKSRSPMLHPVHGLGSAVVNNAIHLLTGGPRPGGGGSRWHQVFSD